METLSIKELAPYLPYRLNIQIKGEYSDKENNTLKTFELISAGPYIEYHEIGRTVNEEAYYEDVLPLLRPLSSINENIFSEIKKCHEYEGWNEGVNNEIGIEYFLQNIKPEHLEYWMVDKLHEYHFDTKNLIGRNLAIDLNTIKETNFVCPNCGTKHQEEDCNGYCTAFCLQE